MSNKEYAFIILGGPMLLAVLIFLGGCKTLDDLKDKLPDVKPPIQTTPTTTTTTTTTTQPPVDDQPVIIPGSYTKDFDWVDSEKDNSTYCKSRGKTVEFRCLVNDNRMERDAWITQLSVKHGGLKLIPKSDGSVKAVAQDFQTANNKYRFEGFRIKTDQSKLITNNTIILQDGDMGGTSRAYWRTIK
jgi:hypothetical protein